MNNVIYKATGFPAASDDFLEKHLNIHEYVVNNESSTFFMKVEGDGMSESGLYNKDILVIDRSLPLHNNNIVVAIHETDFIVRRFKTINNQQYLLSDNRAVAPISITENNTSVWGIITYIIHHV
jgi:DNA polymerase V